MQREWQHGTDLNESTIAAAYRVSPTPLREAMKLLAQKSLLQALPRRGMRIATLTPQLMNMVIGGPPIISADELADMGYGLALYANAALQGAMHGHGHGHGHGHALQHLQNHHALHEDSGLVASFQARQHLVRKQDWDALEQRYL